MTASSQRTWQTGNGLKYTFLGLFALSWWLCCGNFCVSLAVNAVPTLMPLFLSNHGASNTMIGIVVGTLPALLNIALNPIVSTASDRTRTRFGRRIPWLMVTVPLVALSLVFTGWSTRLGGWLAALFPQCNPASSALMMLVIAGLLFQLFNLLFEPVFYCIANDVLPAEVRGRVTAAMGIAGTLGGYVVNQVLVPLAGKYAAWVFTGVGFVFLLGLSGVCLFVKEGTYPPVDKLASKNRGLNLIKVYVKECFGHSIYRWLFLTMALNVASQVCRTMFYLLFAQKTLGLSLAQYGTVMGMCSLIAAILFIPAGVVVDKYHPVPVYLVGCLIISAGNVIGYFFIKDFISFFAISILVTVTYVLQNASNRPLMMALLPPMKFGQFCSANALCFSLALVLANAGGGVFIDYFGYRAIFVWDFLFTMVGAYAAYRLMRDWQKAGGCNYTVPV